MADWLSDKELEEFYRRGSENHDFQYNEAAWDDMEHLLDKRKRRRFFFLALSIVLLGGISYMMSPLFTSSADLNKKQSLTETNVESHLDQSNQAASSALSPAQESNLTSETESFVETLDNSSLSNLSATETYNSNNIVSKPQVTPVANARNTSVAKTFNRLETGSGQVITESKATGSKVNLSNTLSNNPIIGSDSRTKIDANESSLTVNPNLKNQLEFGLRSLNIPSFTTFPVELVWSGQVPELADLMTSEEKVIRNTFLVGLTLGSETTWTSSGEFSSIDYNIGLRTAYYINNKIGINVGASYITDVFEAPGADYKSPQDFWKASGAPGAPMITQAKSSMIEISTGVSYAFNGVENKGVSVGANLISNFMLRENYDYLYPNESDNFNSSWTMANSTWLNALDLTASYRIRLSDNWLLESGPYFKVPLDGIGHGNMKLSSFGIRVSVGFTK